MVIAKTPISIPADSHMKTRLFQWVSGMRMAATTFGKKKMFSVCCTQRFPRENRSGLATNVIHDQSSQNTTLTPYAIT